MSESIRFHLDEHISHRVAEALRRLGIDVTTTAESGLRSADDLQQLEFAKRDGRVIVTRDADFLRLASQQDHAGIVAVRTERLSVSGMIAALILLHDVLTPEEMRGHVEFL